MKKYTGKVRMAVLLGVALTLGAGGAVQDPASRMAGADAGTGDCVL